MKKKIIKINWDIFPETSSNHADALADFVFGGKSLKDIEQHMYDKDCLKELHKAQKMNANTARKEAKTILSNWYEYDQPYELVWEY